MPSLTSAVALSAMIRRFPLPARRSFASIDRTTGSRSCLLCTLTCNAPAIFARFTRDINPIGSYDHLLDNGSGVASHLDWRRGKPALGKRTCIVQGRLEGMGTKIEGCEGITDIGLRREK
jgi:hypothetical protein